MIIMLITTIIVGLSSYSHKFWSTIIIDTIASPLYKTTSQEDAKLSAEFLKVFYSSSKKMCRGNDETEPRFFFAMKQQQWPPQRGAGKITECQMDSNNARTLAIFAKMKWGFCRILLVFFGNICLVIALGFIWHNSGIFFIILGPPAGFQCFYEFFFASVTVTTAMTEFLTSLPVTKYFTLLRDYVLRSELNVILVQLSLEKNHHCKT